MHSEGLPSIRYSLRTVVTALPLLSKHAVSLLRYSYVQRNICSSSCVFPAVSAFSVLFIAEIAIVEDLVCWRTEELQPDLHSTYRYACLIRSLRVLACFPCRRNEDVTSISMHMQQFTEDWQCLEKIQWRESLREDVHGRSMSICLGGKCFRFTSLQIGVERSSGKDLP